MTFLSLWRWFHSLAAYYSRSTHWKSYREWLGQGWCKASFRLIIFLSDHPPFSTGQSLWYVEHRSHHSQISKRNSTEIEVALSQPRCIPCFPFKHNVSFIHWQTNKKINPEQKLSVSEVARSCCENFTLGSPPAFLVFPLAPFLVHHVLDLDETPIWHLGMVIFQLIWYSSLEFL